MVKLSIKGIDLTITPGGGKPRWPSLLITAAAALLIAGIKWLS